MMSMLIYTLILCFRIVSGRRLVYLRLSAHSGFPFLLEIEDVWVSSIKCFKVPNVENRRAENSVTIIIRYAKIW